MASSDRSIETAKKRLQQKAGQRQEEKKVEQENASMANTLTQFMRDHLVPGTDQAMIVEEALKLHREKPDHLAAPTLVARVMQKQLQTPQQL